MVRATIEQLKIAFHNQTQTLIAVDNISFSLRSGETLALLGESGCGKSLTALGIMRLLPDYTRYGCHSKLLLGNEDLLELPESLMRQVRGRRISMIFQEPMTALNPVLRIDHQLSEALRAHRSLSKNQIQQQLIALLKKVEINQPELRLTQYPHQLSGGQKQRVMIAMALANEPEILIADEPTTALDVTVQGQILKLLKKLQQEDGLSILLITHDLGVVKAAADRICVMYAGQLVEEATVDEFFSQVKHPYSQQLLAALPSFKQRHNKLPVIAGVVPELHSTFQGCRFNPRCPYAFASCYTESPVLQPIGSRTVRCHLYPQTLSLPSCHQQGPPWSLPIKSNSVLLSVKNLQVNFKVGRLFSKQRSLIKAVNGLSFEVQQGKTLAIVGESGCGKTTTSRAILRLEAKTAGEILYRGQNIDSLNRSALKTYRKQVQIIFQDPYSSMNPRLTIAEILAEGMIAQKMHQSAIDSKLRILLDQVQLPATSLSRFPHQFSGGQRQRICIARALAVDPELIICDEPTSALDVSVQAQILNLLKELQIELGLSYLFISHNMAVVGYLADEIIVMKNGECVEYGSAEQILTNPKHPYTINLLASVLTVE